MNIKFRDRGPFSRFRRPTRPLTALVLGGGGHRGAAEVGMIRSLMEHGIFPDVVVGSSVGALNASVIAAQPNLGGVELLETIWAGRETAAVFRNPRLQLVANRLRGRNYMRGNSDLVRLIATASAATGVTDFAECAIPLHIVATDILMGEKTVFSAGPLLPPLLASSAVPGLYPPVEIEGRLYCDGGVADNTSLSTAMQLEPHVSHVIAIDVMGGQMASAVSGWGDAVERAVQVMVHQRMKAEYAALEGQQRITILCPREALGARVDLNRVRSVMRAAKRATDELLDGGVALGTRLRPGIFYASLTA